ncbi:Small ribosomal subunit protein uS7 domain-containing protein [[Candida] zeylanoides]
MSMFPICRRVTLRASAKVFAPAMRPHVIARFNSSTPVKPDGAEKQNYNLFTQIYPTDKDTVTEADVDEWLKAVQKMKVNSSRDVETPEEVYLQQLAQPEPFLQETFEPTAEQLAQVETFKDTPMPLYNHPIIENVVCLMMKDGKKSKYQKILNRALYIIYLKKRQDPVQLLCDTLDNLGPLMATRTEKTGTAKNRMVPYPLNQRQRNRYAIKWILDGATKKKSSDYAVRLAEEIMSAHEGKSSGYDRKAQMHKAAIQQRSFIKL